MDYAVITRGTWGVGDPGVWAAAREAEGWQAALVPDHLVTDQPSGEMHPFVALGAMSAATSTITLGTAFANNLMRSPVEFAQAALTIQAVSSGRFEAGLGAGWLKAEIVGAGLPYPPSPERARRFKEAVDVVRHLFAREGGFSGEFYNVTHDHVGPAVDPPVLSAALGGPWTTKHVAPLLDHVEVVPAGPYLRDGVLDFAAYGASVTDDSIRRQIEAARTANPVATVGLSIFVAAVPSPVTDAFATAFAGSVLEGLAGSPDAVVDAVRGFETYDVDRITLIPPVPGTAEKLTPLLGA